MSFTVYYETYFVFILLWIGLTLVGGLVGRQVFHSAELENLAVRGIVIYANVTSKDRDDRGKIRYSFVVDGNNYEGSGGAGRSRPNFDQLKQATKKLLLMIPIRQVNPFLNMCSTIRNRVLGDIF